MGLLGAWAVVGGLVFEVLFSIVGRQSFVFSSNGDYYFGLNIFRGGCIVDVDFLSVLYG